MTNPKKNGDLMLRVRYDSGAELAGPAVITDEGALLVSLGGAASMLVQRADGSLPPHITFVDIRPSHVGYGLPLTDDMAYMAVTAMLRDAVLLPIANTEHISSRMRPLSFFDAFMYSSLNLRVTCRFVAMLILSSIRQAKQDRYRSRSFPMRHHYALRAQKT